MKKEYRNIDTFGLPLSRTALPALQLVYFLGLELLPDFSLLRSTTGISLVHN